jgi:hypothetical protein
MSEPVSPKPDETPTPDPAAAPRTGASESQTNGLGTLPEKRPQRRFFGLLPGKRSD